MLQKIEGMRTQLNPQLELERVLPLREAAEILGVSAWVIKKRYPEKVVWISPRRPGMRLRDCLLLPEPSK